MYVGVVVCVCFAVMVNTSAVVGETIRIFESRNKKACISRQSAYRVHAQNSWKQTSDTTRFNVPNNFVVRSHIFRQQTHFSMSHAPLPHTPGHYLYIFVFSSSEVLGVGHRVPRCPWLSVHLTSWTMATYYPV